MILRSANDLAAFGLPLFRCTHAALSTLAAFLLIGTSDGADSARPKKQYTIEELMDNVRITGASFSADESALLVSSDETGIVNAFRIDQQTSRRSAITRS